MFPAMSTDCDSSSSGRLLPADFFERFDFTSVLYEFDSYFSVLMRNLSCKPIKLLINSVCLFLKKSSMR